MVESTSAANCVKLVLLMENLKPILITLFLARESISLEDSCLLLLRNVILIGGYRTHLLFYVGVVVQHHVVWSSAYYYFLMPFL